jgi:hypothetical protein
MLPMGRMRYGWVANVLSSTTSKSRPKGGFSIRIRRSSLTTSRSETKFSSETFSERMRSASIQRIRSRYWLGKVWK